MPVTFNNAIISNASSVMDRTTRGIERSTSSLTTGINKSLTPIQESLVNNIAQKRNIFEYKQETIAYSSNMVQTAIDYLGTMRDIVERMKVTIERSNTASNESKIMLNSALQQEKNQLISVIENCKFDGRNIFDGSLAANNITTSINNLGHSISYHGNINPYFANLDGQKNNLGKDSKLILTLGQNDVEQGARNGDKVFIEDQEYIFVNYHNYTGTEGQVLIGESKVETAQNLALELQSSCNPVIHNFRVTTDNQQPGVVILTSRSHGTSLTADGVYHSNIVNDKNPAIEVATEGESGALEIRAPLAKYLIGRVEPKFTVEGVAFSKDGGAQAQNLLSDYDSLNTCLDLRNSDNGWDQDSDGCASIIFKATTSKETFVAPMFIKNKDNKDKGVTGSSKDYYLTFQSTTTQNKFTVKLDSLNNHRGVNLDKQGNVEAITVAANSIKSKLDGLFSNNVIINQEWRVDLKMPNLNYQETNFVDKVAVNLISNKFANQNLKFENFDIEESNIDSGRYIFSATISGNKFVIDEPIERDKLISGKMIKLKSLSGDMLTINVGRADWTNMGSDIDIIRDQMTEALINDGFSIALNDTDSGKIDINISNMKESKLLVNSNGQHLDTLSINTGAEMKQSREVLNIASKKINSELTKLKIIKNNLDEHGLTLSNQIDIIDKTSSTIQSTDYMKAVNEYTELLTKMNTIVNVVQAYKKIMGDLITNLVQRM